MTDGERTLTASEVKVLTETASKVAYALGRKDAGEEIAAELVRAGEERSKDRHHEDEEKRDHGSTRYAAYLDAATIARNIASQPPGASPDATSGVPGHQEVSEAVRSPQEPCEDPATDTVDLVGALRKSVEAARERRLAEREQS